MLFMERQMYDDHESEEDTSDEEQTDTKKKTSGGNLKGNQIRYEDFFRGDMTSKKSNPSSSSSSAAKNKNKGNDTSRKAKKMRKANNDNDDDEEDDEEEEGGDFDGAENSDEDFDENGEDDYDFGGGDDDEDDDEDEDGTGEREPKNAKPVKQRALTTHEKREQRMAIQIAQIESKLLVLSLPIQFNSTSGVGLSVCLEGRAMQGQDVLTSPSSPLLSNCSVLCAVC